MNKKPPMSDENKLSLVLGIIAVVLSTCTYLYGETGLLIPITFCGGVFIILMSIIMHKIDSNHK